MDTKSNTIGNASNISYYIHRLYSEYSQSKEKKEQVKRLGKAIIVATLLLMMLANAVLAAFSADIYVTESSGNTYAQTGVITYTDVSYLATNNYILSTGLDTQVSLSGTQLYHMLATDKILFSAAVPSYSTQTFDFTTGNTPATALDVVTGYGGYITIPDAPAIEPGNDFEIEQKGWINTVYAANRNLVIKAAAFQTYVSSNQTIQSHILPVGNYQNQLVWNVNDNVFGNNWASQTFTPAATHLISEVVVHGKKVLNPTGDSILAIQATVAGAPTGTDLGSGTVLASSWPAVNNDVTFTLDTPVRVTAATQYAIVLRAPDCDAVNYIQWYYQNTNPYAGGTRWTSAGGAGGPWVQAAGDDYRFAERGPACGVFATGVTQGEHTILTLADTVNMELWVDTVLVDWMPLAGATVPPNANNYIIMQNESIPGMDYMTIEVGGVPQLEYNPDSIIVGTTMPDEVGANTGVITWGTNPVGFGSTISGLSGDYEPSLLSTTIPTEDVLPDVNPPTTMWPTDLSMELTSNPLYPLFHALSIASDPSDPTKQWDIKLFWWFGVMVVSIVLFALVYKYTKHMFLGSAAMLIFWGLAVAMGAIPFWMIIIGVIITIGMLALERSPQF